MKLNPFARSGYRSPKKIFSDDWSDRRKIHDQDVNLFCWTRSIEPEILGYLNQIIPRDLQSIRCFVDRQALDEELQEIRKVWDETSDPAGDSFWEDIRQTTYDFLGFSQELSGALHLKVIKDNACRQFHTDGYHLRLFTTYVGPGTEWLPEEAVNRKGLGKSNDKIIKDRSRIQSIKSGDVAILKGEVFGVKSRTKGIVHRSPPIEHSGQRRLILRVDLH